MADAQTRKLARQLVGMDERLRHLETVPQLAHSSIDDSALPVYDAEGTVVARIGKQADGTWGAPPLSGPTPSAPLGVSAVGGPGAVTVSWTGEFETGAAPLDFDTLEVLVDGSLAGAIPNRDGGSVTLTVLEGTRYISARIRTLVPRHSSTTSPFAVEVGPAPDALFAEARERIEAAEGQIEQGRSDLEAERGAREAALADAEQALQDLQAQLDGIADSEELQGLRDQITAAQEAVEAAQADATAAKQAADAAQSTADDAAASALAAAGIAADKGRIFYQAEAPTGDDRRSNNLWIDSDDGRVYVWNGTTWEESQSEDLRDAAQAAVAAQQAAEAADSKAQAAAAAAAAADAKAQQAISDAAAAQQTADQATLDAADAHNEAVAAQEVADDALNKYGPLDQRTLDAQAAADAAQARADAAYSEAASKATPAEVTAAASAAEKAAKDAAASDATAKAAQAKADAIAGAAVTAQEKADAARAAAEATAAQDAAEKADQALQEALAALATARGEISAEIRTSANGKNAITVSTAAPSTTTPGAVLGDTWWRVDSSGQIFGQWRWTGSAWSPVTIRSEVVANLDVGKLTVTGESRFTTAVVDRLFADIFAAHKITANELIIAALDENGEIKPDSVGSVQIRDGEISANKIHLLGDPNDPAEAALVATIASIMNLAVENLVVTDGAEINEAVLLKLAAEMITTGVLRTAEAGQRVVIDRNGVILYGIDDDGADYELVRIGPSGENLITAGATTISPSGVQAPAGSFDQLAIGGDSLADILAQLPRGMRAWGQLTSTSQLDGDTSDYARRGEIQTTLEAGRLYRIRLSEHFVEVTGGTNTNIVEELRYSFDGTPILHGTTPNSGTYRGIFARNPVFAGSATAVNGMEFMLDTGSWSAGRGFWLMWMIRPEVAGRPVRVLATSFYSPVLTIEDTGPSMPSTLKRWNDGDGGGGTAEPPDPAPIVVRRTQTWDAASFGGDTRNGTVYQGTLNPYGNRYGGWVFYPAMRSALAGSTIEKFEVYLENAHWYYGSGGTAVLYPNDGSYKGILGSGTTSANWPRYAGRWVTVPSSWHAQIANGTYKGVSVYTTNTGLTFYGQFKGSPTKFRVTYRK